MQVASMECKYPAYLEGVEAEKPSNAKKKSAIRGSAATGPLDVKNRVCIAGINQAKLHRGEGAMLA